MEPLALTVRQAAELLGIGRATIYRLITSEEIKSIHIGRSLRIPRKAIYDYLGIEALAEEATPAHQQVRLQATIEKSQEGRAIAWLTEDRLVVDLKPLGELWRQFVPTFR